MVANTWRQVTRLPVAPQQTLAPTIVVLVFLGGDDKRVLLWNVDQTLSNVGREKPSVMYGEHASNIFCLGFDTQNKYVFSGGNDDLVIQHDLGT